MAVKKHEREYPTTNRTFEWWWDNNGSGIAPKHNEERYRHVERVAREAYLQGRADQEAVRK